MSYPSIVRLHAHATVNAPDWERFKKMVSDIKVIAEKEGPDLVLMHEIYYDPRTWQCLIIEAYSGEEAFLSHLQMIAPVSQQYKVDWKIDRLELMGLYSASVIGTLRKNYGNDVLVHYEACLGSV